jgi:hypothetical protein
VVLIAYTIVGGFLLLGGRAGITRSADVSQSGLRSSRRLLACGLANSVGTQSGARSAGPRAAIVPAVLSII